MFSSLNTHFITPPQSCRRHCASYKPRVQLSGTMEHAEETVCKQSFYQTHYLRKQQKSWCTVVALLAGTMLTFTLVRDRWGGGAAVVSPPDHPQPSALAWQQQRSPPSRDATASGADKYSVWLYHNLYELFGKFLFRFQTYRMWGKLSVVCLLVNKTPSAKYWLSETPF